MESKFNLSRVMEMDIAICGRKNNPSPDSMFTIATRIKSAGWKNAFNEKISTHTGIFVKIPDPVSGQDTMYIAEMLGDGLRISSLYKYIKPGYHSDVLLGVRRNSVYLDPIKRAVANKRIINDSYKYDYAGVVEFLFPFIVDKPGEYYCSELVQHYATMDGGRIYTVDNKGGKDTDDITPYAIQMSPTLKDIEIFK